MFSNDQFYFSNLIIPYQQSDSSKFQIDRLFFINRVRFDTVYLDNQYTFSFRANQKKIEMIPLKFDMYVKRRVLINSLLVLQAVNILIYVFIEVYKLILK